ncbi:MAG: hypothetical protein ABS76_21585 [Pelagibacterium sp. SCN 64-44]|nr:MAG: hypothetical protein ABS76_21585 [Pelagibacterium sp. SCN 64-44]
MSQSMVRAISGLGGKCPACFLVEIGGARFLLDLGEAPAGVFPDLQGVGQVDAILVSHGHADHIGGLHLAGQVGDPTIYATAMTRAFSGHARLHAARSLPLHGCIDIAGVRVETGRAGHAAGGIWMRLGGEQGVLYSGDLCRESLLYPLDAPLPAHTLIADASYGAYDQDIAPSTQYLLDRARRRPLLLPLPPTGRGVEIAVLLFEAGIPLALCDQHRHVAELMLAADPETLVQGGTGRVAAMLAGAGRLTGNSRPAGAMIAANGAATGGLSRSLFQRFLGDKAVSIVFTGHIEDGTDARAAVTAGQAEFLRWNVHPRLRDLIWLQDMVSPRQTIYAFCAAEQALALAAARPA